MPLSGGAPGTRASRRCDRAGRWEPGDYSHCLYTNDITRVLYTFVLVRPGEQGAGDMEKGWGEACWPHGAWEPTIRGMQGEGQWGWHCLLLFSASFSSFGGFRPCPQGRTRDVWATPSIFVPQHSKGRLKGENKDSMRSSCCPHAGGTASGWPWVSCLICASRLD